MIYLKLVLFKVCQHLYYWLSYPFGNKGLHRVSSKLGRFLFDKDQTHVCNIGDNLSYKFNLQDAYWNKLLITNYKYEPELHFLFQRIKTIDFDFFDCGANLGYWSVLLGGNGYGPKKIYAVEPIRLNCDRVLENLELNNINALVLRKAITATSGEIVNLLLQESDFSNTAASVTFENINGSYEEVESISMKDLISNSNNPNLVIKLDIEGQEIVALQNIIGELKSDERDILVSYEDHGNDRQSRVTEYLLKAELDVFYLSDDNKLSKIDSAENATVFKHNIHRGYNFIAFKQNSIYATLIK